MVFPEEFRENYSFFSQQSDFFQKVFMDNTDGLNINELCMSDRPNTLIFIDSLNKTKCNSGHPPLKKIIVSALLLQLAI